MVWVDTYPSGATTAANQLHTVLQNMKELLGERGKADRGAIDEHSWYGSTATGYHSMSEVGWVLTHDTYADLEAYTPKVYGSLHWCLDVEELYSIDEDKNIVRLTTKHHGGLLGLDEDDHPQYYLKDGTRPMTSKMTLKNTGSLVQTSPKDNDGSALPASHENSSWSTAHPAPNPAIVARHLADTSVGYSNFGVDTPEITTYDAVFTEGTHHFFPRFKLDDNGWGKQLMYSLINTVASFGCGPGIFNTVQANRLKEVT